MRVQRQIDQLLAQRAAEWVDALKAGDRSDHAAFLEWMRQSKLHVEHYLETEALDRELRSLDRARGPDLDALLVRVAPEVKSLGHTSRPVDQTKRAQHRIWPAAAALAAVAVGAALWNFLQVGSSPNQIATAVGEQRTLTLADGSQIFINAVSSLRIDYSPQTRDIRLNSGEAVFKVAHDSSRPFVVHTRTASVRALGTQFNVYQRPDDSALVSVIEGRVQVTRIASQRRGGSSPQGDADVQNLGAGEEAQVTMRSIEKRGHPDVARTLGWREGRLYFDETPLEEMVREFNRYGGPLQLELEGIGPGQYRFGGVFNANEPGVLVDILERQKDLSVERRADGVIVISPAARQ